MNATELFKHPSVTISNNRICVEKPDGLIYLAEHDCACPPDSPPGLRLNSFAVWMRINNWPWVRSSENTIVKALKRAIEAKDTKDFIEEVNKNDT